MIYSIDFFGLALVFLLVGAAIFFALLGAFRYGYKLGEGAGVAVEEARWLRMQARAQAHADAVARGEKEPSATVDEWLDYLPEEKEG